MTDRPGETVSLRDYIDERLAANNRATDIAKADVDRRLEEMNQLRAQIGEERGAYVPVAQYDERHRDLEKRLETMDRQLSGNQGRRTATAAFAGILVTVIGITFGVVLSTIPSHAEITDQIKTEAPWLDERPAVLLRLDRLERADLRHATRLRNIERLDAFFCRTGAARRSPGCR